MQKSLLVAFASAASAQNQIWMSRAEALLCDMSGVAWERLLDDANRAIVPDIHDMDDDSDAYTLAAALVYLRLPNVLRSHRSQARRPVRTTATRS